MSVIYSKCPLCLETKRIVKSHLMPKGSYKIIDKESGPITITESITRPTSHQLVKPLLCIDCEQLFSNGGEKYVLENCLRESGEFKLLEILEKIEPIRDEGNFAIYDISLIEEISLSSLIYFGISIFWRSSVTRWKAGYRDYVKIYLGKEYQEQFRQYLLGEISMPRRATMMLFIDRFRQFPVVMSPYGGKRKSPYHIHSFAIQGMQYKLFMGKKFPDEYKSVCLMNKGKLVVADVTKGSIFKGAIQLIEKSKPSRKLKKNKWKTDYVTSNNSVFALRPLVVCST